MRRFALFLPSPLTPRTTSAGGSVTTSRCSLIGRPERKALPRVAALVEAMFIAELRNLLLTAGHDLDALELPVHLTVGTGESFTAPNSQETTVKAGDMVIADARGRVLSAIITGPSDFARIGPETTAVLFYSYAPPGVDSILVHAHLDEIERNVRLISPEAEIAGREIVTA